MMKDWKKIKLGEIAKVISGFAFKSKDFLKDKGIPAIKIKNIKNALNILLHFSNLLT